MIKKLDKEEDLDNKTPYNSRVIMLSKINEIIEKLNIVYFKVEHSIGLEDLYPKIIDENKVKEYIKKEDLKKYLQELKDKAEEENHSFQLLELDNLYYINNGLKFCCDYIIKKFSL